MPARHAAPPTSAPRCGRTARRRARAPTSHEQADDHVADDVEVDAGDDVPEPAAQAELLGEHREQLDRADEQRHRDRQARDRDVVEDLAHRLGERPAVGEVHERAVERVEQRHPGGEQDRQAEDRVQRQPAGGAGAGQHQQRDLGRGVEPEPEQAAERVHVPRLAHRPGRAPVEAVHEARGCRAGLQLGLVEVARGACAGRSARCRPARPG